MIRRPPRSTLFPTRRSSDLGGALFAALRELRRRDGAHARCLEAQARVGRSEEHTSELQSPVHLVCRLLLEKKNNNGNIKHHAQHVSINQTTDRLHRLTSIQR